MDRDSGWGALSRLSQVTAEAAGIYVAVVGAADGLGCGQYQLVLTCDFARWLDYMGLDREAFDSAVGITDESYRVGEVTYDYGCAPSVNCSASIMVVLIPEWHDVWTVEFGCGDE